MDAIPFFLLFIRAVMMVTRIRPGRQQPPGRARGVKQKGVNCLLGAKSRPGRAAIGCDEMVFFRSHYKHSRAFRGRDDNAIDQNGLRENTLLVFTNDNGPVLEEMSKPYRGTKNTTFEGGVRQPAIIRWPGHTKPGTTKDGLMFISDFFPSFITMLTSLSDTSWGECWS